jgi:hypothetical protein
VRLMITVSLLSRRGFFALPDTVLFIITGPTSVIPLAFDLPVAALLLVLIPLAREWLVRRLGDVPQAA